MVGGWALFIYLLHWVLVRSPGSGGFCPRDIMACVASVGKVCHPRRVTAVSSMAMVVFVSLVILGIRHRCGLSVSRNGGIGVFRLLFIRCIEIHHGQHFSHKNQILNTSLFHTFSL